MPPGGPRASLGWRVQARGARMSWWVFSLDLLSPLCAWPNVGGGWGPAQAWGPRAPGIAACPTHSVKCSDHSSEEEIEVWNLERQW